MKRKKTSKSIRKFIRQEKARIRREILDIKEQKKQIKEIYEKIRQQKMPSVPDRLSDS